MIESLLPWLNLELWQNIKKPDLSRKNVDFEQQIEEATGESFDESSLGETNRENIEFLEQLRQMREGTFGNEEIDLPPEVPE